MITLKDRILFTPKESSEFLGVSVMTLWRWVKIGKIKKYALSSKKVFFDKIELEEILK